MSAKTSKILHTEDWLAVWIGFIIIAVGLVAVLTGAFDFSALKFKTWTVGEQLTGAAAAKAVPLGQQLASGAFWLKMLLTAAVLGVLFTVGAKLTGEKVSRFVPAFVGVFLLSVVVRLVSAEFTLNRYLEWAFWALIVGMLISNTVGTPKWLKPAVRTEFYIKTGLVVMGFSVLFSNIAKFGLYGLGIAWVVTPVVILFMWWFGTKVLKMDNKPLVITMASATSVCGTSAAIASGAASNCKKDDLTMTISISIIFTVLMMVFEPLIIRAFGMSPIMGGALIGGTVDSTEHPDRLHRILRGAVLRHARGPEIRPESGRGRNLDPIPEVYHRLLRGFAGDVFRGASAGRRRPGQGRERGAGPV